MKNIPSVSIAVDLGGTRTKTGLVENGAIIDHTVTISRPDDAFDSTMAVLERQVNYLLKKNNISTNRLAGFGLAFPGIVDIKQKRVISTNKKFDSTAHFHFPDWAYSAWKIPCLIENDARAAGVVNMIHAYDPERVILHGGLMKSADIILPFIQDWVSRHAWTPWGKIRVYKSSSEDFAALLGMHYKLITEQPER